MSYIIQRVGKLSFLGERRKDHLHCKVLKMIELQTMIHQKIEDVFTFSTGKRFQYVSFKTATNDRQFVIQDQNVRMFHTTC